MKNVTLGGPDVLLVKEAIQYALDNDNESLDKDRLKKIIKILDIQLAELDVRSPLSHLWKPM